MAATPDAVGSNIWDEEPVNQISSEHLDTVVPSVQPVSKGKNMGPFLCLSCAKKNFCDISLWLENIMFSFNAT